MPPEVEGKEAPTTGAEAGEEAVAVLEPTTQAMGAMAEMQEPESPGAESGLRTGRREEGTTGRRLASKRGAAQVVATTAAALVIRLKIVPENSCPMRRKILVSFMQPGLLPWPMFKHFIVSHKEE